MSAAPHTALSRSTTDVAVVSGGVGAARMLRAISGVVPADRIAAVVNTGDDTVMHGLTICPDLDTITYTLGDAIDTCRGWGLRDESWRAIGALERFQPVRPEGSAAGDNWFNLGDRDLATHLYRTTRLREGASLTTIADEVRRAFDVDVRLLPMSDERIATRVRLVDGDWVDFQDYFVRLHHDVAVSDVRFVADGATLTEPARVALTDAGTVVIAPSNPIVSIGPVRQLPGVDELLAARRESVVAVSPIVGGAALKGPADRLLRELGHEPSVAGVARLYAPIASTLIIDPADESLAGDVEAAGMRCVVTPSVMSTSEVATQLARVTLAAARPSE